MVDLLISWHNSVPFASNILRHGWIGGWMNGWMGGYGRQPFFFWLHLGLQDLSSPTRD